jgi:hypothetical protein
MVRQALPDNGARQLLPDEEFNKSLRIGSNWNEKVPEGPARSEISLDGGVTDDWVPERVKPQGLTSGPQSSTLESTTNDLGPFSRRT